MRGGAGGAAGGLAVAALIALAAVISLSARASGADRARDVVASGVVELFTSQGCPKCPPADRLIGDLARKPGLIALSYPVAIWDFIGWKDTLAAPAFSARQRAYAAVRGDRLVYTPQAIVDGVGVEAGANEAAILDDTRHLSDGRRAMGVPIDLAESLGFLHIAIGPRREGDAAPATGGVYVLRVARTKTVAIDRGDNSGRSVTYTNVVRAMSRIGAWDGKGARFDMLELKSDDEGYVVLVQAGSPERPGAILAAAKTGDL